MANYIAHSMKGREWKNHKYIKKYLSKNGKWVYVYGGNIGNTKNEPFQTRRYIDQTRINKDNIERRSNIVSRTNSKGYGTHEYDYTRTDIKTNAQTKGRVETKIVKGKSFFTRKRTLKFGNNSYTTVERGKLRQAAENGSAWLGKKLKKRRSSGNGIIKNQTKRSTIKTTYHEARLG